MMRVESRKEDPNVNIVLQSGIATGDDKGKQLEDSASVHKAPEKEAEFDLEHARRSSWKKARALLRPFP